MRSKRIVSVLKRSKSLHSTMSLFFDRVHAKKGRIAMPRLMVQLIVAGAFVAGSAMGSYYGWSTIDKMKNASKQKYIFDRVKWGQ